ncbi:unnamed protein product, partial [Allacma fusca]
STLGCRNNQVDWKGFQSRPRKIPLLSGTTTAAENVQLHLQLYNTSRGPSSGNHNICSCTVEYDSVEFKSESPKRFIKFTSLRVNT